MYSTSWSQRDIVPVQSFLAKTKIIYIDISSTLWITTKSHKFSRDNWATPLSMCKIMSF